MENMFSELKPLGIDAGRNVDIFEEATRRKKASTSNDKQKEVLEETDFIFDKTMECPVCGKKFKTKQVKVGRARFVGTEMDLRPLYKGIDSVKYDAVVCLDCGYAALSRDFPHVSQRQIKNIRESISKNFKSPGECEGAYSYNLAIQRYKLALYVAIVKHDKMGERAFLCLKIAWLYRGFRKNIPENDAEYEKKTKQLEKYETEFIENAYRGFLKAMEKERPPICGMNDSTLSYLLSDLARRCGKYEHAERFVYAVLTDRQATAKVKEKARIELEIIRSEKKENENKASDR